MNSESMALTLKFGGTMLGLLLLICLITVATPHIAKLVDKYLGKIKIDRGASSIPNPERVDSEGNTDKVASEYKVYDIYDGTPSEDNDENDNDKEV